MRCPKCGFISFDHLEACLKCGKDVASTSEKLRGSVFNVAAPAFLKFTTESEEVEVDEPFIDEDDVFVDDEIRDPDLDILIDDGADDEREDSFSLETPAEEKAEADTDGSDDGDREISFKLDDFEEDAELADFDDMAEAAPAAKAVAIELPDELSDMSDLEPPPALMEVAEDDHPEETSQDLDLDLDFDLNLDDEELGAAATEIKTQHNDDLLLQDLDLDEEPTRPVEAKKGAPRKIDLDDDLNFDLDLGDLKLDDDEKF